MSAKKTGTQSILMKPNEARLNGRDLVAFGQQQLRNEGIELTPELFETVDINLSAVKRRVATLTTRRSVKKQWQAAWLIKAIQMIDLTTLAGDDTPGRVKRLCAKARNPLRADLLEALGLEKGSVTTGAVCVYPTMVGVAVDALAGSDISVASVATGFPAGLTPMPQRLEEVKYAVKQGADEIDMVVTRANILNRNWQALYDEVRAVREACGEAHLKVILATGDLKTLTNVYRASMVSMMAGGDFVKTSTGMEAVNATLAVSLVMVRAVRDYLDATQLRVGFKPAGGVKTSKDALAWLFLMREELGREWLEPELFRFGASSLLGDLERQIEHFITGRYSANYRHAMS